MKPLILACSVAAGVAPTGCGSSDSGAGGEPPNGDVDHRQRMRSLVGEISSYAKGIEPDFLIIPQNGHELLSADGAPDGQPATAHVEAIDGVGREDLFYGYDEDDVVRATDGALSILHIEPEKKCKISDPIAWASGH